MTGSTAYQCCKLAARLLVELIYLALTEAAHSVRACVKHVSTAEVPAHLVKLATTVICNALQHMRILATLFSRAFCEQPVALVDVNKTCWTSYVQHALEHSHVELLVQWLAYSKCETVLMLACNEVQHRKTLNACNAQTQAGCDHTQTFCTSIAVQLRWHLCTQQQQHT